MQFKAIVLAALLPSALAAPTLAGGWEIHNFGRDCRDPNACVYNFAIDFGDNHYKICALTDSASPATTHSFYDVPCKAYPNLRISWGWDLVHDFAVMTVVDKDSQTEAFFGYNSPNSAALKTFPDVGPNASQHV